MSLAEFHLPKEKGPWLIGGAIALAFLVSSMMKKSAPAAQGAMLTPADLLDAVRATASDFAGAATAGVQVGGSIATSGIGAGVQLGQGGLDLAGRVAEAQGRVTETAVGSLSRSIDSTLATLAKLADSAARTFTPAPFYPEPQPYAPAPRQVVSPIAAPPAPAPTPATSPVTVSYGGYASDTMGPRTAGPSDFERQLAAEAPSRNLGSLLAGPTRYKLVTGEWITIG